MKGTLLCFENSASYSREVRQERKQNLDEALSTFESAKK